jgi:glycosyltransferase involved in cell wall biosynthesis
MLLELKTKSTSKQPIEHWSNGLKLVRLRRRINLFGRLSFYEGLYDVLLREKPDFIMVHGSQTLELLTVKRYVQRYQNCRMVIDIHSDYYNSARNFISMNILHKIIWKSVLQSALPFAEKVYGTTPWRVSFAKEVYGVPTEKLGLTHLGADVDKIDFGNRDEICRSVRNALSIASDDFVIVTGGKIDNAKRVHRLIECISKIDNPQIHLIIFGSISDSFKNTIEPMIAANSWIHYVGWIPADKVYDYYLASDLAVFPGTHSVLWEQAVCSGLPALFKKWPGNDYLDKGNAIFLYSDEISELEQWLKFLCSSENQLIAEMRAKALKCFEDFSYRKIAASLLER